MNDPKWEHFIVQNVILREKNNSENNLEKQNYFSIDEIFFKIENLTKNKILLQIAAGFILVIGVGLTAFLNLSTFENPSWTQIKPTNQDSLSIYNIKDGDLLWEGSEPILEEDLLGYTVDSSTIIDY